MLTEPCPASNTNPGKEKATTLLQTKWKPKSEIIVHSLHRCVPAPTYWLDLVNPQGCSGRDSISVGLKECLSGFYAPSAFTPNGDGKNDVFRPLLFGNVKQHRFTVYNRWGEVIFQSTELGKGWNGKVAGVQQQTDVYVWQCTYQLDGADLKTEKGTVTVVR